MAVIFKFPNRKVRQYSDQFLKRINPTKIGDFIQAENPGMSLRAADAMALAVIYSTYLQLVFEEEGNQVIPSIDDFDHYIWAAHDKKTLH